LSNLITPVSLYSRPTLEVAHLNFAATLPHEKYYDLDRYEKRILAIQMGETLQSSSTYDPRADMESLRNKSRASGSTRSAADFMSKEQLEELRRIERERVEGAKMKRMGMEVKGSMGVRWEEEI
jgi:hypothetical protein